MQDQAPDSQFRIPDIDPGPVSSRVGGLIRGLLVWVVLASCCSMANAQGQLISGAPALKQITPVMDARPVLSPLERRNLVQRPGDDQNSIAAFLKNTQVDGSIVEVVVGRGKLITLQQPLIGNSDDQTPVVAVGDPTVLDFDILPNGQMIRLLGKRVGITDFSVITADGKPYSFEIHVVYDMMLLRAYLKQLFPNADLSLTQMYEHVVVEGEAASTEQSNKIIETIQAYLSSAQVTRSVESTSLRSPGAGRTPFDDPNAEGEQDPTARPFVGGTEDKPDVTATLTAPQIINLIRIPGVQQVMLQVKIVEVDRTALRQMGTSWLYRDSSGRTFGTRFGTGSTASSSGGSGPDNILGLLLGQATTAFAILPNTSMAVALDLLRTNNVISVLAEPNLMAMHGQKASFLAGGEFPVPVPQSGSTGAAVFTIEYKDFGVLLDFVPYIMEDGRVRLQVAPEVSTLDETIGIITQGLSIPGLNTRRVNTTVELREGQTLAIGGLLQIELAAHTNRLPGVGDLPYIGSFFSNNSHQKVEKELVILVTPYFVEGMEAEQVGPLPGCEIRDPTDHEFYGLGRIESRLPPNDFRATNAWDDPLNIGEHKRRKSQGLFGNYGFSK